MVVKFCRKKGGIVGGNSQRLNITDLSGIYKDIAEVIGIDATILLHNHFQGQQITFPKKLYTKDYIIRQVKGESINNNIKYIANKYGYTERRLRQILREQNENLS